MLRITEQSDVYSRYLTTTDNYNTIFHVSNHHMGYYCLDGHLIVSIQLINKSSGFVGEIKQDLFMCTFVRDIILGSSFSYFLRLLLNVLQIFDMVENTQLKSGEMTYLL